MTRPADPAVRVRTALALQRTARWIVDDSRRQRYLQLQDQLAAALAQGQVLLRFVDGSTLSVPTPPRGYRGLGIVVLAADRVCAAAVPGRYRRCCCCGPTHATRCTR
ncbi:MAG: hypothetical protein IPH51_18465 [Rubrivivax sp.]|nr:hypothetical protein [Rubrivivax sp.]